MHANSVSTLLVPCIVCFAGAVLPFGTAENSAVTAHSVIGSREVIGDDIEIVYETPANISAKAVLLMAHGCSGAATDMFDRSEACQSCTGNPLERVLVSAALKRGYVVVAVSSINRVNGCWGSRDVPRVKTALQHMQTKLGKELPVAVMGASSGGSFAWKLGNRYKAIKAVAVVVMGFSSSSVTKESPPTVMWHMPKDMRTATRTKAAMKAFEQQQRPALELTCNPFPVTPSLFTTKLVGVDEKLGKTIVSTLQANSFIDNNGDVKPGSTGPTVEKKWDTALAVIPELHVAGVQDRVRGARELVSTAAAWHAWCEENADQVFDFLDAHTSTLSTGTPSTATPVASKHGDV